MSLFSVVIPYHNREAFLPRTLESVAAQTLRPLQLILVNNGSTDASEQICRTFAETRNRPEFQVILLTDKIRGAAHARNTGLAAATGTWISFFDSDDEMSPDFLQKMKAVFERENCDVVAAATRMVFEDGREKVRSVRYTTSVADQILTGMLSTQSVTMRTDFARRIGGWNEGLETWDDWEWGIRTLLARPVLFWMKGEAFHRIHQHGDSLTGISFSSTYEQIKKAFATVSGLLENDKPVHRKACAALCLRKAILAGHLAREKAAEAAREALADSLSSAESRKLRFFCSLLYRYTCVGGKGAWLIAGLGLRFLYKRQAVCADREKQ